MELEFDCGKVVKNIGMPSLAIEAHLKECTNKECIENCKAELKKVKGFIAW